MLKRRLFRIIAVAIAAFLILNGVFASYASASMYDMLQQDGKLCLIVKFNDFTSWMISYKLAGREEVINDDLNEYILQKIDQKYNLKKLKKLFQDRELARTNSTFARELDNYFVIEIDKNEEDVERVCDVLESLYGVDMVEPDVKVDIVATPLPDVNYIPNDHYVTSDNTYWREGAWGQSYPDMWGLRNTQVFEAWDLFGDARTDPGRDIVVAVIDTGVDFSHPDINANRWINPGEIPNNGVDDDGNGYADDINGWDFVNNDSDPFDGHGHGTHCSGTIAGVTNNSLGVAGIAPNAKIMAVKGLSDSGSGYISWLANCILYAANNGADVLSNSWGGWGSSSTLADAVNYAHSRGCVVIAAAGNSNGDVSGFLPANIPNVIAVAATDHNDVKAYFSNYGSEIDVSAPGVSVLSTTGGSYASWNGTSMACPHVAGIAALILSQDPSLDNDVLRERLKDTADNIDAQNPSWQGRLGTGRVNAYQAILAGGPVKHNPVLSPIGNKNINEGELLNLTVSATDADGDPLIYSVFDDFPGGLERSGDANFFLQSETVYEGTLALQSGEIGRGESSTVSKSVDLLFDGTITFYWKASSAKNNVNLSFYIDGAQQAEISGEVDWKEEIYSITSGPHTLTWTYSKGSAAAVGGSDAGWIDSINISYGTTETYDIEDGYMPAGFTTGGDGSFYVQHGGAHGGAYALAADPGILDNQSEYVQKTVTAVEGATLTFWWKVSSEYYYDFLEFYINDILQTNISGMTLWQQKSYTLSAGTQVLKWRYAKDYSVTSGGDTGWVDDIVFDNGGGETIDFEPVAGEPNPLPEGASFDANTRVFTWTPDYDQAGVYQRIRFIVTEDTEDERSDYEDITITVNDVSRPPVLDPIGDKTVNEMELLQFTLTASDPEGDVLVYSASNLPTGASFDVNTQVFSWRPTYRQSGIYPNVHFEVSDSGGGSGGEGNDVNTKLLLHTDGEDGSRSFTDSSSNSHDVSAHGDAQIDTSTKKWGSGALPFDRRNSYLTVADSDDWDIMASNTDDWTIDFQFKKNSGSNSFLVAQTEDIDNQWTLWYDDHNKLLFRAWSNSRGLITVQSAEDILMDTNWHHIALCKVGSEYGIYLDGTQVAYMYNNSTVTYSAPLYIGCNGIEGYANGWMDEIRVQHSNYFNANPNIARTDAIGSPIAEYGLAVSNNIDSEDITITVIDVNHSPVLNAIGNKSVNEGDLLQFTIQAADVNGDVLTYTASNLPTGATFDTATQTFSWTPTYKQQGTYSGVHFEVSDGKTTDSEDITVTVNNVNAAPVLSAIGDRSVDENSLLEFTITASDSDNDALTYYTFNLPTGASFDAPTQTFSWTPSYTDAGTYSNVMFIANDGNLTDTEIITITVNNVNRMPVIDSLTITPSSTIAEGESITIAINASDPDGDTLSYLVQNEPSGSGFVDSDFYWTPGYNQAGIYSDITFTVFDGELSSDAYPATITVTNLNDAPTFITEPTVVASYTVDGEAKDVKVIGDYAYVAYDSNGLNVFDISDLNNIYERDAITSYYHLTRIETFGDYAYLIDDARLVEILDITIPSTPYRQGDMIETEAVDTAVNGDTAYLACGDSLLLYDVTNEDSPEKLDLDLGKADKIITKGDYVYAISKDEDLKVIDATLNEVVVTEIFGGAEGFDAQDIIISGSNVYIAKDDYGLVCFDVKNPTSPSENGEFYIANTAIKELDLYNKNRIFALGYLSSSDTYKLIYIDSTDPMLMTELRSYSFAEGLTVNSLHSDGNRLFIADQNGMEILASPLEDTYTVEAESELKITLYTQDPDEDSVTYVMDNKPDFAEATFTDNGDNTATFTWTPTAAQIGTYGDISFAASDTYQEVLSKTITISVVEKDTNSSVGANTKLLLHSDGEEGSNSFTDSSPNNYAVSALGNAKIDTSTKKWGSGALSFDRRVDYLRLADSDDWDIMGSSTDDWTIDFQFKRNRGNNSFLIAQTEDIDNQWVVWYDDHNKLLFRSWSNKTGIIMVQSNADIFTDTNWHHIALCKVGSEYGIYLDGTQVAYMYNNSTVTYSAPLYIGCNGIEGYANGWMDEIRVQHSNYLNASPKSSKTDTITVPEEAY